jgi:hypothetical protein
MTVRVHGTFEQHSVNFDAMYIQTISIAGLFEYEDIIPLPKMTTSEYSDNVSCLLYRVHVSTRVLSVEEASFQMLQERPSSRD